MRVTPGQSRTQSWASSAWEPVRQSVVVVLGSLHPPGSGWVTMCTLTLIRSLGLGRGQIAPWVFPHSLSSTYIPEVTRGGSSPERGAGAWWSWTPEPNDGVSGLALFPVGRPFVHVGHVLVSLSWCLRLSFTLFLFLPQEPEKKANDAAGNPEPAASGQRDCQPPGFREVRRPSGMVQGPQAGRAPW